MSSDCNTINPLKRDGVSQAQRRKTALDPDYFKPDERNLTHLLRFAFFYAGAINYYDRNNVVDGQWREFLQHDPTFLIGLITTEVAADHRSGFQQKIQELMDEINPPMGSPVDSQILDKLQNLFDFHYEYFVSLDAPLGVLDPEFGLVQVIQGMVCPHMRTAAEQNRLYENMAATAFPGQYMHDDSRYDNFGPNWYNCGPGTLLSDPIFPATGTVGEKVEGAIPAISKIFEDIYEQWAFIINKGGEFLQESLENYPKHQPNNALLIAFLELFGIAQDRLNEFTGRHLDFYYKEVLQLSEREAAPDFAHILFELAKNVDDHIIAGGTRFKAGKDALGQDIYFELPESLAINTGRVESIKSVFVDRRVGLKTTGEQVYLVDTVQAAPIANSPDGAGAEWPDEPLWKPFGESQFGKQPDQRSMPDARLGFSIASPFLVMQEGNRELEIRFEFGTTTFNSRFKNPALANLGTLSQIETLLAQAFKFQFTGPESWHEPAEVVASIGQNRIEFTLTFQADQDPVTYYNEAIHLAGYQTEWPVCQIELDTTEYGFLYQYLRELNLKKIRLDQTVKSITNLLVQNDGGGLDPSKPFFPFGPSPVVGSSLYVGHAEAFSKNLSKINLHVEWLDPPADLKQHYLAYKKIIPANDRFTVNLKMLDDFYWKTLLIQNQSLNNSQFQNYLQTRNVATSSVNLEEEITYLYDQKPSGGYSTQQTIYGGVPLFENYHPISNRAGAKKPRIIEVSRGTLRNTTFPERSPELKSIGDYRPGTRRGFLKLELNNPDFQHGAFRQLFTQAVLDEVNQVTGPQLMPNEPYTPQIKTMSLDYESDLVLDFTNPAAFLNNPYEQLFHLTPFGHAPVQPVSVAEFAAQKYELPALSLPTSRWMPQFTANNRLVQGGFYIGVADLTTPGNLTLLFRVLEGSGDVRYALPKVTWEYLSHNTWVKVNAADILTDTTKGLIQTGIIEFKLPASANKEHTRLPAGQVWLRASIERGYQAMPSLIEVVAQAGKTIYVDLDNDPDRIKTRIPAETISKLAVNDFQVKTLRQPDPSFGGNPAETEAGFRLRVSERLRHKDRSINIWDYEHMVLSRYPNIYKVKCLNHTDPVSGRAPGKITVVVIPDVRKLQEKDRYEPMVGVETLTNIHDYLAGKMSPFAARFLEVENAIYEPVQADFKVRFYSRYDVSTYKKVLNNDLKAFLAPWATESGQDIAFGGRLHRSVLVNFVENLYYVDVVKDFKLKHFVNGLPKALANEVIASTDRSVLGTAPNHHIVEY